MSGAVCLGELYRAHAAGGLRRARQLLGSEDEAREALQHVFLSLVERPEQTASFPSFAAWLYGAVTHHCLNQLRNRRTRERLLAEQVGPAAPRTAGHGALDRIEVKELLARLPEPLAAVAVYSFVDEMTQDEIARVMGCSRRRVSDLVARARALLEGQPEERSA